MTLPSFFVIGAPKAGTTALYNYVAKHPDVHVSPIKEPRYFICDGGLPEFGGPWDAGFRREIVHDPARYRALFDGATTERAIGEFSPTYLYWPGTAGRIRALVPGARLIALLRDPAERAFSNYLMNLSRRQEDLSFGEALDAEEERIRAGWSPSWHYRARGFYARQLRTYLDAFPREQLLILFHDDLEARPLDVVGDVFRFLDVDDSFVPDVSTRHNVSLAPRSRKLVAALEEPRPWRARVGRLLPAPARHRLYERLLRANLGRPELPAKLRRRLVDGYREDILELQELTGRDLAVWLR